MFVKVSRKGVGGLKGFDMGVACGVNLNVLSTIASRQGNSHSSIFLSKRSRSRQTDRQRERERGGKRDSVESHGENQRDRDGQTDLRVSFSLTDKTKTKWRQIGGKSLVNLRALHIYRNTPLTLLFPSFAYLYTTTLLFFSFYLNYLTLVVRC